MLELSVVGQNEVQSPASVVDAFGAKDDRPSLQHNLSGILLDRVVGDDPAVGHGQDELDEVV